MNNIKVKTACSPHLGDYAMLVDMLLERCLNFKTMTCPPITKQTVETGSKNSPDTVCTPFKITLGNFIEALEKGANVLVMPGIGCRLGFYDLLQKQILTELGYEFEMLILFDYTANAGRLYKSLVEFNPELTAEKFENVLYVLVRIAKDMDELADFMRRNMAFELVKGEFEKNYNTYLKEARKSQTAIDAEITGKKYKEIFNSIKINKPEKPLRVGIVGDLYTVIEPSGNCYLEKWLADNKCEIVRSTNLTFLNATLFNVQSVIAKSGGYADYNLGGSANNSVALSYKMAKEGIDGIIHVKAATCSPEITAMSILQNISRDHDVPIIYFTFDTETSEAGFHTRLEAFHDMLTMKKKTMGAIK